MNAYWITLLRRLDTYGASGISRESFTGLMGERENSAANPADIAVDEMIKKGLIDTRDNGRFILISAAGIEVLLQ